MAEEAEDAKKDMDQLGFETKAFEALERDFQEVSARVVPRAERWGLRVVRQRSSQGRAPFTRFA